MLWKALQSHKTLGAQVKRWWVNKYQLPVNHELFLSRSFAEHQLEMLEDLAHRREELYDQLGEKDVNVNRIMEHINMINRVFGDEPEAADPLIDKWEQELMEGKIPNLDEGLEE